MNPVRRRVFYQRSVLLLSTMVAVGYLLTSSRNKTPEFSKVRLWYRDASSENETLIINRLPQASAITGKQLELWEQPTLLNLINFTWLMNNEAICQLKASDPTDLHVMPILVHTSRHHFKDRLALRRTWGALPVYRFWDIRFVFLLGQADRGPNATIKLNQTQLEKQEKRLQKEQSKYGDLVIGNFIDSYRNLIYKHLMGYKWVLNFCPNATFVMKIDDDIFVDIMKWLDWRSDELEKIEMDDGATIPDLYCHTYIGTKPIRDRGSNSGRSKWYVSFDDWPEPDYPTYCSGWAYALTVDLVKKIYLASNDTKIFWVDDVFVTGVLMEAVKKKFNFKPEERSILGDVTLRIQECRPLCEQNKTFDDEREFKAVAWVPRGKFFERDMMCMFNKTWHDRKIGVLRSPSNNQTSNFLEPLDWDEDKQSENETLIMGQS